MGSYDVQSQLTVAARARWTPWRMRRRPSPDPGRAATRRLRLDGRDLLCLALLAVLFAASIAVVDPRGDFPLNDDWSFARSARVLAAEHDWRPLGWAGMTQISHAALGAAVCWVSSCSFEHLRSATLIAGLALLVSCFGLFRCLGTARAPAALAAAAVLFNPVLYPLTFTFMTDVDFALLMVGSAAASIAVLRTGRWRDVLISAVLILLATLSRQLGIAMAVALLPLHLLTSRERLPVRLIKAGLPLAVCLGALLTYEHWMRQTGRLPLLYDGKYQELAAALAEPGRSLIHGALNLLLSWTYLGFVCLPLLLVRPIGFRGRQAGTAIRWASLVTAAVLASMAMNRTLMPVLGNVFGKGGVGPFTLRDTYVLRLHDVPDLPLGFWIAVTGCSLLGLWLLVFHTLDLLLHAWPHVRAGRLDPALAVRLFGVVTTVLYLLPLLPGEVYDRYVVVAAPLLCLSLVPAQGSSGWGIRIPPTMLAAGYAAGLAIVSILATHDYMSWNRARWIAIADVEAAREGDAATMDGGFEYNGYRSYDQLYAPKPSKSWWWVADDAIQIGFGPMPGTRVLRRYPYWTWFPADRRAILVLRRQPASTPP